MCSDRQVARKAFRIFHRIPFPRFSSLWFNFSKVQVHLKGGSWIYWKNFVSKKLPRLGFEPGLLRPQRSFLTTRRSRLVKIQANKNVKIRLEVWCECHAFQQFRTKTIYFRFGIRKTTIIREKLVHHNQMKGKKKAKGKRNCWEEKGNLSQHFEKSYRRIGLEWSQWLGMCMHKKKKTELLRRGLEAGFKKR